MRIGHGWCSLSYHQIIAIPCTCVYTACVHVRTALLTTVTALGPPIPLRSISVSYAQMNCNLLTNTHVFAFVSGVLKHAPPRGDKNLHTPKASGDKQERREDCVLVIHQHYGFYYRHVGL